MPKRSQEKRKDRTASGLSMTSTASRLGTTALSSVTAAVKKIPLPQRVTSLLSKLVSYLKLVLWTLRVAQKPDIEQYKIMAKMTLGLVLLVGLYAFMLSLVRLFVFGRPASLSPPVSYVVAAVTAGIILGLGLYLYFSLRKTVKEATRKKA